MDVIVNKGRDHIADDAEQALPLLHNVPSLQETVATVVESVTRPDTVTRNSLEQAINEAFQGTATLAKRLPTGTALAFQLLTPMTTNQGLCDHVSRVMTSVLIVICALSTFLLSFTDSFKDKDGNVVYGFATFNGMWVIDGSTVLPPLMADRYRLKFIDFVHAITSLLVFSVIALMERNTVQCFFPLPSLESQEVLTALPIGIGVLCSMLFVTFPNHRHGIGFPLTA